jgi:hypothetical protein
VTCAAVYIWTGNEGCVMYTCRIFGAWAVDQWSVLCNQWPCLPHGVKHAPGSRLLCSAAFTSVGDVVLKTCICNLWRNVAVFCTSVSVDGPTRLHLRPINESTTTVALRANRAVEWSIICLQIFNQSRLPVIFILREKMRQLTSYRSRSCPPCHTRQEHVPLGWH